MLRIKTSKTKPPWKAGEHTWIGFVNDYKCLITPIKIFNKYVWMEQITEKLVKFNIEDEKPLIWTKK